MPTLHAPDRIRAVCALLVGGLLLAVPVLTVAQAPATPVYPGEPPALLLWPAGAPGAVGDSTADRPTITPWLPAAGRANGTAVVVFPGGGYAHLSLDREGAQMARWLNERGVAAFVVRYRLGPRYHHPAMLQDAQRAVRLVRARAADWMLDPQRIGVLGFSAGGHAASSAGTHFDAGDPSGTDAVAHVSSRPDFMVLVYPVITMDPALTHAGSRRNLLGERPTPELERLMSNETQVTRETPPTLLVASTDDASVPVENSLLMYRALRAAKVPVELHVFETGRHGFALAPGDPSLSSWLTQCALWMTRHGWLAPTASTAPSR
jgi:acetyl esterase/lipase